jgi:hypothetical protein
MERKTGLEPLSAAAFGPHSPRPRRRARPAPPSGLDDLSGILAVVGYLLPPGVNVL